MNELLEGIYVRLLPLTLSHHQRLCEIGLNEDLWTFTTIQVETESEMLAYIQTALAEKAEGTCQPYVITTRDTDELVGTTRYHSIDRDHRRLEIGFTWIAPRWQRTFVNTEAKYLMLKHAFEDQQFLRVQFRADASNEKSQRAILRLGARPEGTLRSFVLSKNRGPRDLMVYSILASEWPGIRSKLEQELHRMDA